MDLGPSLADIAMDLGDGPSAACFLTSLPPCSHFYSELQHSDSITATSYVFNLFFARTSWALILLIFSHLIDGKTELWRV